MLQPRISAIEKPGGGQLNLETLCRLAAGFDVGLEVKFVPFSELLDWDKRFDPEHFSVPTFDEELPQIVAEYSDSTSFGDATYFQRSGSDTMPSATADHPPMESTPDGWPGPPASTRPFLVPAPPDEIPRRPIGRAESTVTIEDLIGDHYNAR